MAKVAVPVRAPTPGPVHSVSNAEARCYIEVTVLLRHCYAALSKNTVMEIITREANGVAI
jgi:hypothetical protein